MADETAGKPAYDFAATLETIFNNLITLNIITAVGTVTVDDKGKKLRLDQGAKVIWTEIDLLQGDMTTVIHPEFKDDAGKSLRDFHTSREEQARAIIKSNIETLEKIGGLIKKELDARSPKKAPEPSK